MDGCEVRPNDHCIAGEVEVSKPISQRQARTAIKVLAEIRLRDEARMSRWSSAYPGGTNIALVDLSAETAARLYTAQLLEFAVVVRMEGNSAYVYAVKP